MSRLASFIKELETLEIHVESSSEALAAARDGSQIGLLPLCRVYPASPKEAAAIVKLTRQQHLPLTVAGGRTGLSGGCLGFQAVRLETQEMNHFEIKDTTLKAQAGASLPELIRACEKEDLVFPFQPASATRREDSYDYLGVKLGPVSLGGALSTNASGLVGCKLGAALDWVLELTVLRPNGATETITERFERFVGTEGRYGIILEARIKLLRHPPDPPSVLVSGRGPLSFTAAAVALGECGVLPLVAEGLVQTEHPPDLPGLVNRIFPEPEKFLENFGHLFGPWSWLVLLQGTGEELTACKEALGRCKESLTLKRLTSEEVSQIKEIRSAASDEVGRGLERIRGAGKGQNTPPLFRAAAFIQESIKEFSARGIKPKAEHNQGALWPYLVDEETREAYRKDVLEGQAFDDGSMKLFEDCNGDLKTFLEQRLAPVVTKEMVKAGEAVNFPGNEDLLIRAEQFTETMELLERLMTEHGACPVPLFYCHLNFRKQPGLMLVHNRLLMDVHEFTETVPEN